MSVEIFGLVPVVGNGAYAGLQPSGVQPIEPSWVSCFVKKKVTFPSDRDRPYELLNNNDNNTDDGKQILIITNAPDAPVYIRIVVILIVIIITARRMPISYDRSRHCTAVVRLSDDGETVWNYCVDKSASKLVCFFLL